MRRERGVVVVIVIVIVSEERGRGRIILHLPHLPGLALRGRICVFSHALSRRGAPTGASPLGRLRLRLGSHRGHCFPPLDRLDALEKAINQSHLHPPSRARQ